MNQLNLNNLGFQKTGNTGFLPSKLSQCEAWYEADFGTYTDAGSTLATNGQSIKQWNDRSGNSRHITAPVNRLPTLNTTGGGNSRPAIIFEGVTLKPYFDVPNFMTGFTAGECFVVVKVNTDPPGAAARSGLDKIGSTANVTLFPFTDGGVYDSFGTDTRKTTGNPTPALTNFLIYDRISASGEFTTIINGTQQFTTGTNTVAWTTAPQIGGGSTAGSFLDGAMCAWILYSRKLSTTERNLVKTYLATKYAITVA